MMNHVGMYHHVSSLYEQPFAGQTYISPQENAEKYIPILN